MILKLFKCIKLLFKYLRNELVKCEDFICENSVQRKLPLFILKVWQDFKSLISDVGNFVSRNFLSGRQWLWVHPLSSLVGSRQFTPGAKVAATWVITSV